jgi:regulator of cell morphogenesis and NO signaling
MPRLVELAAKVRAVHTVRHPELSTVDTLTQQLADSLTPHLAAQEDFVFPAARRRSEPGGLTVIIDGLRADHDTLGALFRRLRLATGGYAVPSDGCASYQSLYRRLADLEAVPTSTSTSKITCCFPR